MGHHHSWTCCPPQKGVACLPQLEPLPPLQLLGSPHNSSTVEKSQEVEGSPRGNPAATRGWGRYRLS